MRSHVMSVICCEVMRCNGMRSHEFVVRCGWLRCHVVWFEVVVSRGEVEDELVIRTTKYCKYYKVVLRTPRYYAVLLHSTPKIYKVPHSTTPVLLCTTQYYSSTTKYYSVLHSTTLCTKYYSSTTPYYKVLLQYYSVLQSTTPVLQSTTPVLLYYSVLQSTTPVLQSTTPYYKVLLQYYSVLPSTTICIARSNRCLPPTSPSILRARKNDSHH